MGRWVDQLFTGQASAPATSVVVSNKNANGTSIQASITGTSGAVTATVTLYGSHKNAASGVAIATVTLGDGTLTSDIQEDFLPADYPFYYAILSAISGTGAAVDLLIGH